MTSQQSVVRTRTRRQEFAPVVEIQPDLLYRYQQIKDNFLCGISRPTVKRWIKLGKFPEPIKASTRLLMWRGKDLLNFLEREEHC